MSALWPALLDGITRVSGVRGAGCRVWPRTGWWWPVLHGDVDGAAVAALAASLAMRLGRVTGAIGSAPPRLVLLDAELGGLMAAPAGEGLLLVAVTDAAANVGLLRLALRDAAERMA